MNKEGASKNRTRLWAVLFWLAVWQASGFFIEDRVFFVTPVQVAVHLARLLPTADFWQTVGRSYLRITGGFLLAVLIGTVLACLSAAFIRVRELLSPLMLAIRSIPVVSFVILAIILVSPRKLATLISFTMGLPILYTNTLDGIDEIDRSMKEMADVFQIPAMRRFRFIYLPEVLPYFRAGVRVAAGLCWKAGAAAEVIGVPAFSIGLHLYQAKIYIETADLFAWTLVIVLLSFGTEKLSLFLVDRVARAVQK
ncbi:MAG: ABC transporter permease subunit [Lachnospiraceae bacterium]|jgi:NitT/TauT family transport system permease protein|nr:ABC transporter permease subunit [Lachnospiraceae bacterium]MDY6341919.1 ABC transporter permease subunit [Lachnospiraceae bacterium]